MSEMIDVADKAQPKAREVGHHEIRDDAIYTAAEIATLTGHPQRFIDEQIASGTLRSFRMSKRIVRIRGEWIKQWLREGSSRSPRPRKMMGAGRTISCALEREIYGHADGYIYFLRCGDFVKVGYSKDVANRTRDLRKAGPNAMELLGSVRGNFASESRIHKALMPVHHEGEWFHLSDNLLKGILDLCNRQVAGEPKKVRGLPVPPSSGVVFR